MGQDQHRTFIVVSNNYEFTFKSCTYQLHRATFFLTEKSYFNQEQTQEFVIRVCMLCFRKHRLLSP